MQPTMISGNYGWCFDVSLLISIYISDINSFLHRRKTFSSSCLRHELDTPCVISTNSGRVDAIVAAPCKPANTTREHDLGLSLVHNAFLGPIDACKNLLSIVELDPARTWPRPSCGVQLDLMRSDLHEEWT